ncbi:MAG: response regulator [Candidatus Omnitrophota bacterium]|nr:response regulator [Candidatus Omnitrophota bacterium]MBU1929034.1 response regulator [Candidatus Omnitrophota bacterium]MBU2035273.1 response regulator [Candidatus Omnitrophota bacterium]MBU2257676.1 response regulator [Candidatus Omnitrophota bacterium]
MKRILVVEDDPNVLSVVASRLEVSGFAVTVAEDGQKALEQIYKEKPDLIVLDLMLPKRDGFSVCNQLKREKKFCKIPIVMLTARTEPIDIELGDLVGADLYITKPFDTKELIIKIEELIKEAEARADNSDMGN